jgi:hypothetical protein
MPRTRLSVDTLRSAIAEATGDVPTVHNRGPYVRIYVAAPQDETTFRELLDVLLTADAWGSSDGTGQLRMWAAVLTGGES